MFPHLPRRGKPRHGPSSFSRAPAAGASTLPVAQRATKVCACLRMICLFSSATGILERKCSMKSCGVMAARFHLSLFTRTSSMCCGPGGNACREAQARTPVEQGSERGDGGRWRVREVRGRARDPTFRAGTVLLAKGPILNSAHPGPAETRGPPTPGTRSRVNRAGAAPPPPLEGARPPLFATLGAQRWWESERKRGGRRRGCGAARGPARAAAFLGGEGLSAARRGPPRLPHPGVPRLTGRSGAVAGVPGLPAARRAGWSCQCRCTASRPSGGWSPSSSRPRTCRWPPAAAGGSFSRAPATGSGPGSSWPAGRPPPRTSAPRRPAGGHRGP